MKAKDFTSSQFAQKAEILIRKRHGRPMSKLLLYDPLARYATAFNDAMEEIHERHIAKAFQAPLRVLARMVNDDHLKTFDGYLDMMHRVVAVTAFHFEYLSDRLWTPFCPRPDELKVDGDPERLRPPTPLFISWNGLLQQLAAATVHPGQSLDRDRVFCTMLSEARWLGLPRLGVFREVRKYRRRFRKSNGAFRAVALLVVKDPSGKIKRIRKSDPDGFPTGTPCPRLVRHIRRLYHEACCYLENRAFLLGWRVPPLD